MNGSFASIDIGSNSAQLYIAVYQNQVITHQFEKVMSPQLGRDLSADQGKISFESLQRLQIVLQDFMQIIRNSRASLKGIVLTEAVRKADNPLEVIWTVEEICKVTPEIITGEQEAHLAHLGVRTLYPNDPSIVVDLGAGSMEFATAKDHLSLPIGALRMANKFGSIPGVDMEKHLKNLVKESNLKAFAKKDWILSGGTAVALGMYFLKTENWQDPAIEGFVLDTEQLEVAFTELAQVSEELRARMPGMLEGRSQIILPGIRAILFMMKALKTPQIKLTRLGLKEGILAFSLKAFE